jgi:hypothetical protein
MAEPKKKAPETDAAPEAEKTPDAAPAESDAPATQGTEAETPAERVVERGPWITSERVERELRLPRGGEGAVIVSALVELHRIGLHDGTSDGRYLKAARAIGDQLVEEILGPSPSDR